jgi:hypothetical protein
MTILFLIMGIVLKTNNTSIKNITIGFIILSLPDLLSFKYIDTIITYYFILIFPSLIKF